jgi:hypothetical protein
MRLGTARREKMLVGMIGGAFVLVEKSCGSWRAKNESPRQSQAHGAGRSLHSYWSVDPRRSAPHQRFDRLRRFVSCLSAMSTHKPNHACRFDSPNRFSRGRAGRFGLVAFFYGRCCSLLLSLHQERVLSRRSLWPLFGPSPLDTDALTPPYCRPLRKSI